MGWLLKEKRQNKLAVRRKYWQILTISVTKKKLTVSIFLIATELIAVKQHKWERQSEDNENYDKLS